MKIHFDEIFAVTAPGLETVCAGELTSLLSREATVERGGVRFSGGLEELYQANLWSRVASRILVRVGEVRARDFPELFRKVKQLPWGRFVHPDRAVIIRSSSRGSRLVHTDRIAMTVSEAINGALGRSGMPAGDPQLLIARMENDSCLISIDSSGELLHRRGYRTEISRAPLRETLAAGILKILEWDGQKALYDPMCGSGTFLIEAALLAANRAPGQDRPFAFQQWPRYRAGLWNNLLEQARKSGTDTQLNLHGSDADPEMIAIAGRNADRVDFAEMIRFGHCDLRQVTTPATDGLIICNPPYGVRLDGDPRLGELYRAIGAVYAEQFKGWQGALFCPPGDLIAETGLDFRMKAELLNGGIPTGLFVCDL